MLSWPPSGAPRRVSCDALRDVSGSHPEYRPSRPFAGPQGSYQAHLAALFRAAPALRVLPSEPFSPRHPSPACAADALLGVTPVAQRPPSRGCECPGAVPTPSHVADLTRPLLSWAFCRPAGCPTRRPRSTSTRVEPPWGAATETEAPAVHARRRRNPCEISLLGGLRPRTVPRRLAASDAASRVVTCSSKRSPSLTTQHSNPRVAAYRVTAPPSTLRRPRGLSRRSCPHHRSLAGPANEARFLKL